MKILVVGTGAVGGYYGGHLAAAGHEVTFVARGEHGSAIRTRGLSIDTPTGTMRVTGRVLEHVDEARGMEAEVVLVAVKAGALSEVQSGVAAALSPSGFAIPMQNGVDSEEQLAGVIGRKRVIGCVAQVAAELAGPGRVVARSNGGLVLSPLDEAHLAAAEAVAAAFSLAGISCRTSKNLKKVLWTKLLWNAPFNGICALTDRTAGEALAVPSLEALVLSAMKELQAVARAEGAEISDETIEKTLAVTRSDFQDSVPSMLQDVRAGRATEADALQGAVVRGGLRHGIPTPVHSTLLALLEGLNRREPRAPRR